MDIELYSVAVTVFNVAMMVHHYVKNKALLREIDEWRQSSDDYAEAAQEKQDKLEKAETRLKQIASILKDTSFYGPNPSNKL